MLLKFLEGQTISNFHRLLDFSSQNQLNDERYLNVEESRQLNPFLLKLKFSQMLK